MRSPSHSRQIRRGQKARQKQSWYRNDSKIQRGKLLHSHKTAMSQSPGYIERLIEEQISRVFLSATAKNEPVSLNTFKLLASLRQASRGKRLEALGYNKQTAKQVSAEISRCRDFLAKVFSQDYPGDPFPLTVAEGRRGRGKPSEDQFQLQLVSRNGVSPTAHVQRFWAPHLNRNYKSLLWYGEPLFIRRRHAIRGAKQEVFERNTQVNTVDDVKERVKLAKEDRIDYPYLRYGEVRVLLDISNALARYGGPPLEIESSRNGDTLEELEKRADSSEDNLIIVGNTQSNGALSIYQVDEFRYYSKDGQIEARRGRRPHGAIVGKPFRRIEEEKENGKPGRAYVLFSRRFGRQGGFISMIASDSGRGMKGAGKLLSKDEELEKLFAYLETKGWPKDWPLRKFQLLIEFEILGDSAARWNLIDPWLDENVGRRIKKY